MTKARATKNAPVTHTPDVASVAESGLSAPRQPLPGKGALERSLGVDLTRVPLHRGPEASAAADVLGAEAYAWRGSVVLGDHADRRSLAEEVVHTLQQRGPSAAPRITHPGEPAEMEARAMSAQVAAGQPVSMPRASIAPTAVARSGGSSQANDELQKKVGKAAQVQPSILGNIKAKPHTKKGTGGGQSGVESHQQRDAQVLNKAKQNVIKDKGLSPATFQSSQMRSNLSAQKKSGQVEEKRQEKRSKNKLTVEDNARESVYLTPEEWDELEPTDRQFYIKQYKKSLDE